MGLHIGVLFLSGHVIPFMELPFEEYDVSLGLWITKTLCSCCMFPDFLPSA